MLHTIVDIIKICSKRFCITKVRESVLVAKFQIKQKFNTDSLAVNRFYAESALVSSILLFWNFQEPNLLWIGFDCVGEI